jgi:hypothetical protein
VYSKLEYNPLSCQKCCSSTTCTCPTISGCLSVCLQLAHASLPPSVKLLCLARNSAKEEKSQPTVIGHPRRTSLTDVSKDVSKNCSNSCTVRSLHELSYVNANNGGHWYSSFKPLLLWKSSKYYICCECVCSLSYPACKAHAPYYIVICSLSGCTVFFHIIS